MRTIPEILQSKNQSMCVYFVRGTARPLENPKKCLCAIVVGYDDAQKIQTAVSLETQRLLSYPCLDVLSWLLICQPSAALRDRILE